MISEILNKEIEINSLNINPESKKFQTFKTKKEIEKDWEIYNQTYSDVMLTQTFIGMKG